MSTAESILIIHQGHPSDFVRLEGFFRKLRETFPGHDLYLVTGPDSEEILRHCPYFSYLYMISNTWDEWKLLPAIRKIRFSHVIDLTEKKYTTQNLLLKLNLLRDSKYLSSIQSGIDEKAGDILKELGIPEISSAYVPYFWTLERYRQQVVKQLEQVNPDKDLLIAISLSAREKTNQWNEDNWFRFLYQVKKVNTAVKFLFLHQPTEASLAKTLSTPFGIGTVILPAYQTWQHFYEYVVAANVIIGFDRSLLTLAHAAGTPIVSLTPDFSPSGRLVQHNQWMVLHPDLPGGLNGDALFKLLEKRINLKKN